MRLLALQKNVQITQSVVAAAAVVAVPFRFCEKAALDEGCFSWGKIVKRMGIES